MTDEELAEFLCIKDIPHWKLIIAGMDVHKRKAYDRMRELEDELKEGKHPKGVIVLEDRG